jgi:uncharacterized protein (DUF58 family)
VAASLFDAGELRRLDRLALVVRRVPCGEATGDRRTRRLGTGGEFADHRPYADGDDPRYVDWNVYGRLDDLVVKRFESEETVDLLLLVDRSASMAGAKSRLARRAAAALAHVALRRRDAVALAWLPLDPARPVETFRGPRRLDALHERVATAPDAGRTDHRGDLDRLLPALRRRGLAVVVSDFYDPAGAVNGLSRLSANGFDAIALHVLDPADVALPEGETLRAVDRETGEEIDVDVSPRFLAALHAAWRRRAERLEAWCVAHGVLWRRVEAQRSFWDVVHGLLRAGALSVR